MAINDILRAALDTPADQKQISFVLPAPAQVAQPDINSINPYQVAAGQGNQAGAASMNELETDLRTMLPADLYAKYGNNATNLILAQAQGVTDFRRDSALDNRTASMIAGDTVSGVGSGLGNAFAGLGALGLGLVNDNAGAWAAEKIQQGNEWVQSTQSDTLNARRRTTAAETALENRDSTAQYEQERESMGEIPASLRRVGRDAVDAFRINASDPVTFGQGTSDAVGSLLAAGPITKTLKAVGAPIANAIGRGTGAPLATAIVADRIGSVAATPAAIAAMEAGGAYQQTAAEVMGKSFEDLEKNSPQFRELVKSGVTREDARTQLASEAGRQAALIQAPIAAATGTLVNRFESNPFRVTNVRQALENALVREPLEEGIQSGTGGMAQNYAIRENVDPKQSLSEGVGEQVGQGALFGFSAAGTVQLPGAGARAVQSVGKSTMQGLKSVTQPVFNGLIERADRIIAENEKNSPIADSVVGNAAAEAVAGAPEADAEIRSAIDAQDISPELKAGANSYVDSLMSQLQVSPQELDEVGYSENIRPLMANAGNRVEAMQNLADYVNRVKEDTDVSLEAGYALLNMARSLNDFKMREAEGLDGLDPESRPAQLLNQYAGLLANINTPKITRALNNVQDRLAKMEDGSVAPQVTDENVQTPSGRTAVNEALTVAENAPQKLSPEVADQILYQESQGRLTLTPEQRAALNFSKSILSEQRAYNAEVDRLGLKRRQDLVSKQVTTDDSRDALGEKSALMHYKGIRSAMAAGNTNLAGALLADFGEFVQHMQNKVGALNTHFAAGNPNANGVTYMALQPDRTWKKSAKRLYVNTWSTKSLEQAHQIALEAQVLANVYNGLSDSFPDLNGGHVGAVSLDSRLDGPIQEVADSFRRNSRVVDSAPTEVVAQPEAVEAQADNTAVDSPAVEEVQTPSENVVTPETVEETQSVETPVVATEPATETVAEEEAPAITNKEWMKGDQAGIRPDDGRARIVDGATSLTYDRADDAIKVNIIATKKEGRGQGGARKVLTSLVQAADAAGLPVSLDVAEQGDTDRGRLIDFYKSLGFVQQGDTDNMTRAVGGVVEAAPEPTGMDAVYPDLVQTEKYPNHFKEAFSLPAEALTHTLGAESPLTMVRDALKSGTNFLNHVGDGVRHDITVPVIDGYSSLFRDADFLKARLNTALQKFLTEKNVGGRFLDGTADVNTWIDGKLINITDNVDGKLTYNENLLENAVLAGLHWLINANTMSQDMTAEDFTAYTGVEMDAIGDDAKIDALNQGMSTAEAKRTLAQKIKSYWGLTSNRNAPIGYVEGIPESMAAEIIHAMIQDKMMNLVQVTLDESNGLDSVKTFNRYVVAEDAVPKGVKDYPTAIEHAVMVDPEEIYFIGDDVKMKVARTQMNNPQVQNTADDISALTEEQKTPFYFNESMLNVYAALKGEAIQRLFGAGNVSGRVLNKAHKASLDGKNRTITAALNSLGDLFSQTANLARAGGTSPYEMAVRFRYNMSSVARMQMLGKYSPQSNKLVREALTSYQSTVNLNDPVRNAVFLTAIGQHFGIKIHNMSQADAVAKTLTALNAMGPALELVESLNSGKHVLQETDVDTLINAFKAASAAVEQNLDLTPAALHSLSEYVRINDNNRGAFKTDLYVEADGMTNGPANAMGLMTVGDFTEQWITNMQKVGVTFGAPLSANEIRSKIDGKDLYQTSTDETAKAVDGLRRELVNDQFGTQQMNRLFSVLDAFFGNDINFDAETETLSLGRGVLKNPLTITIYGSGANGIAGNITQSLVKKIYERLSDVATLQAADSSISMAQALFGVNDPNAQQKMNDFYAAMDELTGVAPIRTEGGIKWNSVEGAKRFEMNDPVKFQFNKEQIKAIQQNMMHLFVAPMRQGITATVGASMMKAVETLRRATQVQSIYLEYKFKAEVAAAIEEKAELDPTWKKTEFLSQAELDSIFEGLAGLAPLVETPTQRFFIAGSSKADVGATEFGRGLSSASRMSSDAFVYGPSNAGVSGAAYMTIGTGDGRMMQWAANQKMKGTLKVFDGVNIAVDERADEYSRLMNQAVYESWKVNPLAAVNDSWEEFMRGHQSVKMTPEMLKDLYRALGLRIPKGEVASESDAMAAMVDLGKTLKFSAESAADRITARESVANSIDQMAAQGQPYSNGVDPVADPLTALRVAYKAARDKRKADKKAANPSSDGPPWMSLVGREHKTGVRILSNTALQTLGRKAGMTADQQLIFDEIRRSQAIKDWKTVYGTPEQIAAYQDAVGSVVTPMDKMGATVIGDKTIYLYNSSNETLVHEQVHAATFEKVLSHYEGNSTPEVAEAVGRIEQLMAQFMEDTSNDPSVVTAQAVITEAQSDLDVTDPVANAKALNEFMAWALSNEQIAENLKAKQAPSLVQMAKSVVQFLKQIFWGRKKAPAAGTDALSTLQFNTGVIIRSLPVVADGIRDTALFQNPLFGNKDRLSSLQQTFNKKIADYMRVRVDPVTGKSRRKEVQKALQNTALLAASVNAHGFAMTAQEASTFRSIVGALATEIQLDPAALAKAQELYTHVTKTVTVDDFMPENPVDPQASRYYAQEQYNVIMGNYLTTTDSQGRSSLLPVFVGLAMTNDQFRTVLRKLSLPKSDQADGRTMDGMLENVGQSAMDKLSAHLSGTSKARDVGGAMDALMHHMQNSMQDTESFLDQYASKAGGVLDRGDEFIRDAVEKLSEAAIAKADSVAARANNKATKALAKATAVIAKMATEKNGAAVALGFMDLANRADLWKPLAELFVDLVGRTDENSGVYDMIKQVRSMVSQDRQQFRENLPVIIDNKFKREMTNKDWSMLHRGLGKTDLAALGNDALTYMDDNVRAAEIANLEDTIRNESPQNFGTYQKKMQQLATYMMTGVPGHSLLRNAFAVSRLYGEQRRGSWKAPSKDIIDAIDKLTSLYAVEQLDPFVRSELNNLITNEAEGMDFSMAYLHGQRKDELSKAKSARARANQFKGYIPTLAQQGVSLFVAEDTEFAKLAERSYIRVADYKGSNLERGATKKGYYYAPVSGLASYNQGIFQNVRHTANGVDAVTGFSHDNTTAGRITERAEVQAINGVMRAATASNLKSVPVESLMPIWGDNGEAVAYERAIDPQQMQRLNHDDHFAKMIGVWRGRQVEEAKAQFYNEQLVEKLFAQYEADTKASSTAQEKYVDLFNTKDAVIRDAVSLFSAETRAYIKGKFGEQFYVRKDMINDAIGYRAASTGDIFTGNTRWSKESTETAKKLAIGLFGNAAYSKMVNAEAILQNVVASAKDNVVVKSIVVPISNSIANVYQLLGRGVPLMTIARGYPRKASEIDSYVKSRVRMDAADGELRVAEAKNNVVAARKLRAEIRSIQDSHKRLSIWPLLEAGEFTAISDLGIQSEDIDLYSGRLNAYIEQKANQLPDGLRTLGRYALVTRDTALYQGLQKAIQYGDFIAKAISYDDMTQRQKKSPAEALGRITEEFVNYDRLPGRFRGALESNGLLWFWNFKIRSAKVGLSMIRNNPLHSLLAIAAPAPTMFGSVGLPIEDNLFAKMADGTLDYSVGVGQAFRAPLLNPWVNLVN